MPSDNNKALDVDTTGLSSFLGFMSESAFEDLENQLTVLCQNRGCKSAKKLTYQQTKNRFDVTSFILLSDGSVYQCDYNLKSCAVEFSQTSYTEADIQQMKEQQLRAEQGYKGCPLTRYVHGCGHIMRILQGLNEKTKCIFYGH